MCSLLGAKQVVSGCPSSGRDIISLDWGAEKVKYRHRKVVTSKTVMGYGLFPRRHPPCHVQDMQRNTGRLDDAHRHNTHTNMTIHTKRYAHIHAHSALTPYDARYSTVTSHAWPEPSQPSHGDTPPPPAHVRNELQLRREHTHTHTVRASCTQTHTL